MESPEPALTPTSLHAPRFPFQVHCISTEFTPRKHGGEKGVPFRVQIDTFKQNENGEYTEHLHSASCQIKVFKVGRPRHAHLWSRAHGSASAHPLWRVIPKPSHGCPARTLVSLSPVSACTPDGHGLRVPARQACPLWVPFRCGISSAFIITGFGAHLHCVRMIGFAQF